ncbi:16S rRNA methyltransferase [Pyrofollis japonicus]|uniref:16S rRNA methyltransferase n=1 Tax=Pyrofollis japonicus TaxID=3060460 RepID=UPI00295BF3FA|nr:16S rRNA methyltransferase [Pyrofollis japonicus]BEP18064.1 16S rRNA methyltransferase [Pyrofollis japonicus]
MTTGSPSISLVIAEAALELVPRELWGHPAVYKSARKRRKRPGEILLDRSLHHQAMQKLPSAHRRGRPDIVHIELLEALESPLARRNLIHVYIHTINDYAIFIKNNIRLPRNYNRFIGLIEQLFAEGQVPPGSEDPLMLVKPMNIRNLVNNIAQNANNCKVVAIDENGVQRKFRDIARDVATRECSIVLVKGFTNDTFSSAVLSIVDHIYTPITAVEPWLHVSRLLAHLEDLLGAS